MRLFPILTIPAFALAALLSGCNPALYRAEFAAPQSRWPSTLPSPVWKEAPPPPTYQTYCYRTLAAPECYVAPQPTRSNFSGTYPELPP